MIYHKPVLLQATSNLLDIHTGDHYVDATLGGGGHASEIVRLGGKVLGLDQDADAILACSTLYKHDIESGNMVLVRSNFTHLSDQVRAHKWQPVKGILFDLGVSSHQIDTPERGFSFQSDGPLDMRMDDRIQITAADIVNTWPEPAITHILSTFGEIQNAKNVAGSIVNHRPYQTTHELAAVTKENSRQAFQALRIAVNDELSSIETAVQQAFDLLDSNGRLAVITFHSLEDRFIKQTFLKWAQLNRGEVLTKHPIVADQVEIDQNNRSKSAKLRVFLKK